jgi:hypothetical protein
MHLYLKFIIPALLLSQLASASDTLRTLTPGKNVMLLGKGGEVGMLKDDLSDHDTFDIGEMMFAPANLFQPWEKGRFRIGYTMSAYWLRLDLTDTTDRKLILEINNPYLSQVRFYQVADGEVLDTLVVGSDIPFTGRRHWNLQDTIRIPAGDTVHCLLYIPYNRSLTDFNLFLTDAQVRAKADRTERLILIVFFCLILVYLLMLGLSINLTKFGYYWYYFAYVLLVSGYIYSDIGLGYKDLWPKWPYIQQVSLPIFANAYLIAGAYFVMAHFHTNSPVATSAPAVLGTFVRQFQRCNVHRHGTAFLLAGGHGFLARRPHVPRLADGRLPRTRDKRYLLQLGTIQVRAAALAPIHFGGKRAAHHLPHTTGAHGRAVGGNGHRAAHRLEAFPKHVGRIAADDP